MKPGLCLISAEAVESLAGPRAPFVAAAAGDAHHGWGFLAAVFATLRGGFARMFER